MLKHRSLLKSIIDFSGDVKERGYIAENFNFLLNSNVDFKSDEHARIFNFVKAHSSKFVDVPSFGRLLKKFEEDPDTVEELNKLAKESSLFATNFKSLVAEVFEEQQKKALVTLLKETSQISEGGVKVNREFIRGPKSAVEHFLHKSTDFLKSEIDVKSQGSMREDSKGALKEYHEKKSQNKFDGLLTGLASIDEICKGMRSPELWLLVAYVSELKTTQAMNYAYTQAVEQGKDIQFISLEMSFANCRDIFVCVHSANLNLWLNSEWHDVFPLDYSKIQDGELTQEEEEFFDFLCNDLENNPEYGDIRIYQPPDGLSMSHLKAWSEIEYRKKPFHAIYLDYIELMKSEGAGGRDYTIELNQRIKDLKQFALNFNGGSGMMVCSAYQANRKGKEHADKNAGEYRLDALSYANEAERSADVIIYSYLNDELRENNKVKIGCLKNRSRPKFKQFEAKTHLASRKMYELSEEKKNFVDDKFQTNKNNKVKKDDLINDLV